MLILIIAADAVFHAFYPRFCVVGNELCVPDQLEDNRHLN